MRSSLPAILAGLLAAFVAYFGTFSVIVQGFTAVGASPTEAASGLLVLSVAMGLCGVVYSWRTKIPLNIAWSTPGAAFLAASGVPEGGFAAAVGAFVAAGLLTVVAGLFRPLARLIALIPTSLANAMLAGILFELCLAPVRAVAEMPLAGTLIILTFLGVGLVRRLVAVPAAAIVTVALLVMQTPGGVPLPDPLVAAPVFTLPVFTLEAIVGIGLPLFIISMASQNVPGLAILKANGYEPAPGRLFTVTGLLSMLIAPFGAHSVILAAITAALCAGEEAGPDRTLRYRAGISCGLAYVAFGLSASLIVVFAGQSPLLVACIAGLALLGAFAGAIKGATEDPAAREAATIGFLVTASGIAFFGISSAFWGLAAGGAVLALQRAAARRR